FVLVQIIPDSVTRPIGHGIEFYNVAPGRFVERIHFEDADAGTGIGLLAAQASDPAVELPEFIPQREDFANPAAKIRIMLPKFGTVHVRLLLNWDVRFQ